MKNELSSDEQFEVECKERLLKLIDSQYLCFFKSKNKQCRLECKWIVTNIDNIKKYCCSKHIQFAVDDMNFSIVTPLILDVLNEANNKQYEVEIISEEPKDENGVIATIQADGILNSLRIIEAYYGMYNSNIDLLLFTIIEELKDRASILKNNLSTNTNKMYIGEIPNFIRDL